MNTELTESGRTRDAMQAGSLHTDTRINPPDSRRHPRHPYSGRVSCREAQESEMAALDISAGGVGLLSSRPFKIGQPITLTFLGDSVQVKGVIARVRPVFSCDWLMGIAFLQEQPELIDVMGAIR